ncbi:unnamed protein product [Medioppia subpectinata]|uniref:RCC1-like domain-containing protein n=1 Tax=Medioppia subpectinata TaxID=1979941 RepID=A0A7R9PW77_9ACAR|nr:unnamed protein product [Medioppia subpectinata]CAG2103028.1 unnamed protein product [Medioppia subpectinata]
MPPKTAKKPQTKRKGKAGEAAKKRKKRDSFSSSGDDFDSDDNNKDNPFKNNNHNNSHVDEDNGTDATGEQDIALQPKLPELVGRLLVCGGTNWDLIGRKELPKAAKTAAQQAPGKNLWSPHKTPYRVRALVSSCTACHSMIITEEGKVMTWGRNDKGQLGHGDVKTRNEPTVVDGLASHQIVGGAVGRSHTLFLTSKGQVFACGDNKMGQLGIGSQSQSVMTPTRVLYKGKPVAKMSCGAEFSMILDAVGNLYSFGSPEYGQLGHNSEGKYFASGNKLAYRCELTPRKLVFFIEKTREGHILPLEDVSILDVTCGVNHSLAIDRKKRCFSWGFGGYGRLGHTETKDELMPRNIKTFDSLNRGVKSIFSGGTFSMAIDENGLLYFWGQNKSSGEATMYPKNVQDLNGWNVRSIGCANKSIVLAADDSLISWGPSPTYGELGYGENKAKSSTTPQEVKPMEGIYTHDVVCGFAHTLIMARDDGDQEKEAIDKLPVWP